jgi:hypothetical protein
MTTPALRTAEPTKLEQVRPASDAQPRGGRTIKRIARVTGGWALLAVGAALLVLPGPGLLVIAAGLALLATEYTWAARLLNNVKQRLAALRASKGKKKNGG